MDLQSEDTNQLPIQNSEEKEIPENQNVQCPIVENTVPVETCKYLKNGRLVFKEPKLRPENHPLLAERILYFRDFRKKIETTEELHQMPIEIPPAYMCLLASLVQDSEESLTVASSHINDILSPFMRRESLSHSFELAIQKAIKQVANYTSYGLSDQVHASIENASGKIPAHLHINRWEVEKMDIFPEDMQNIVVSRRKEREEMCNVVSDFISKMPPAEQTALVNAKIRRGHITDEKSSVLAEEERKQREEEKKLRDEEKKQRDEERKQREEEKKRKREDEKKYKEDQKKRREDERKKKEQSQLRLTALFTKAAPTEANSSSVEKSAEVPTSTFFPPFHVKEHVLMADTLKHYSPKYSSNINEFIAPAGSSSTPIDIDTFLSNLSLEAKQKRGNQIKIDIRTLLLSDSENISNAHKVRKALRMKLLQFTEDVRPAYYGTFTQTSDIITGKTPFALDTSKLDYEADSEAEWEPEGEGEEIRSGDEEEEDADIIDPEDAGWLVPEGYLSDNEGVEGSERPSTRQPNSMKKMVIREIVLGPYFEGENEENDLMKPFGLNFSMDNSEEGYDPFFEENPVEDTNENLDPPANSHIKPEFTEEHKNALISVISEKAPDSIPGIILEAKAHSMLKDVSKRQLEAKIKDVAVKEKRGSDTRATWYVK